MRFTLIGAMAAAALSAPSYAEVKSLTPQGFAVVSTATVSADPAAVYAALVQPGRWWKPAHSYSGDAANMSLEPKVGGCFCEKIPKSRGEVEHMRVAYVVPGKALRLRGALGPLQAEGINGALSWTLKPAAGGTEISQTSVVGGYIRSGMDVMASAVDQVLADQLAQLKAYVEAARK